MGSTVPVASGSVFFGIGTDLVSVQRIAALAAHRDSPFVGRWFCTGEVEYCFAKAHPARHLAARLAAKEAVFKALRISSDRTVPWRDIEVSHDDSGAPVVRLAGELARIAKSAGVGEILLTMAHTDEHATATALVLLASKKHKSKQDTSEQYTSEQ